jgi:regulator of sigma E protease
MAILIFILILSVLVLVHEFGHFAVAKKLGIKVEEFGLGIPPRILSKKIGETVYSLNLLPFGGFVKVEGEDPSESTASELSDPRSFASKTPGQRIAVLVAGVFMNLVLAVVLFYAIFLHSGFKTQYIPLIFDHKFAFGQANTLGTVVSGLMPDSPAERAGIELGEAILSIDGMKIANITELRDSLKGKLGQDVKVELMDVRNDVSGPVRFLTMQPTSDDKGNVILGVFITKAVSLNYTSPTEKAFAGFLHSYNVMDFSFASMKSLIGLSVTEKSIEPVSSSVAGPVGIYQLVASMLNYGGSNIFFQILDFVAIMSLSLAFINILPLPALDGGRIFFVVIEKMMGRPLSVKFEAALHRWGFAILLSLLALITIKDIFR